MNNTVSALTTLPNGDLVAGGLFTTAGGVPASRIARWNGTTWAPLGTGVNGNVYALTTRPNGDLVAGGDFTLAGGVPVDRIARWDGSSWSALPGGGLTGFGNVRALALLTLPNGDLVVGGEFVWAGGVFVSNLARWDGASWSAFDAGGWIGSSSAVRALATLPNGHLVAGGSFRNAASVAFPNIARWDGTDWWPLGTGLDADVRALARLPNDDLVAGGSFSTAGGSPASRIARWDGLSWSPLGTGVGVTGSGAGFLVNALTILPGGDLAVGGSFTSAGGVSANSIARWNGTSWSAFGTGMNGAVQALTTLPNGDLVAGGAFLTANGLGSPYLARLTTTCPATAVVSGAGCSGAGGPNVLSATTLPWIGSTFRATGTGMPPLAFVLAVTGFAPASVPLAAIFPQGGPGCSLLASPDVVDVLLPTSGVANTQLALPNTLALVGLTFYQQMLPLEVDAMLNILELTGTNALSATIGAF